MSGFSSEMRVADDEDPRAGDGSYDATARIVDAGGTDDDTTVEAALRPRRLDEFPGRPRCATSSVSCSRPPVGAAPRPTTCCCPGRPGWARRRWR